MHLRFDGRLGFPGGMIDKVTDTMSRLLSDTSMLSSQGEQVEAALNREIAEEMGEGNPQMTEGDWLETCFCPEDKLLLHFYHKELTEEQFSELEQRGLKAKEYGVEVLGIVR